MFRRSFSNLISTRVGGGLSSRSYHDTKRYAFVIDPAYGLVEKLRSNQSVTPEVDPTNRFPSSFSRNLIHPKSNHVVSKYASSYYSTATPYYGIFPIQFYASELVSMHSPVYEPNTHTVMLYPERIKINNVKKEDIPYVIELCKQDKITGESMQNTITVYFFCDSATVERSVMLFQWFNYCFRSAKNHNVEYLFSSGNLNNDQNLMVIIQKKDKTMILSQIMTLREVDVIVNQVLSY